MKHLRIGVCGPAGVGKDTVAKYLCEHHGFIRNAFADPLKRAGQQMFMLNEEQTWGDGLKEVVIPYWGLSPRQMFQKLGTEGGRMVFGDDLWLRRWRIHFDTFGPVSNYVTSDVRFPNEAEYLRDLGFTIVHVNGRSFRQLGAVASKHASELGVEYRPDLGDAMLLNNGTFADLYSQIRELVSHLESVR